MSKPESSGQLSDFDYQLPDELIARNPLPRREDSRLLVVDRRLGRIDSRRIEELPSLLDPGDCLVVNDTRVLPARLLGHRVATGGGLGRSLPGLPAKRDLADHRSDPGTLDAWRENRTEGGA